MCGIAGIYRFEGTGQDDVDTVGRMNRLQMHRGPDDEGLFRDRACVLGHRRLSIIDLSRDGRQPFASDDGRFQLVFNGEIYNYIELRKELEDDGYRFRTRTDTEVLLKAYLRYGENCLEKFNGMFAFAVYDHMQETIFLARDRMGIKPLYYVNADKAFYFASEIKAFTTIPGLKLGINEHSMFDYLVFNRTDVFDQTFFEQVKRLPNGHFAKAGRNGMEIAQWWNPEDYIGSEIEDSAEKIEENIRKIMVSAVQLRMRSDVPVGSCLSGGLDSSIIVGILFEHCDAKAGFPTFTASFPGHGLDETRYIDLLNQKYPFKNHRTFPTAQKAHEAFSRFVWANDEPTTNHSFFSQYEVMSLAREHGTTVLLDGQGGDENFAGYQYFHGFDFYGLFLKKRYARLLRDLSKSVLRKQNKSAYQTFVFQLLPDSLKKKTLLKTVPYVEKDFFYGHIDKSRIYNDFFDANDLNQSLAKHFQYKLEHLLRMEDRNSMAFSIEARVPYLDYRLVEYVLKIPADMKLSGGETKRLQKRSVGKYTVPEILDRKDKIGFGTPGEEWMRTENWLETTERSYSNVARSFPHIFRSGCRLPETGFDRWKINQLDVWRGLFI